ncbi:hypothetical protein GEMRC1_001946 [Eukaryota sp. GEM-RC1]
MSTTVSAPSQRTRLALNLFDAYITSFQSNIPSVKTIPFWKSVIRTVDGRFIYRSSLPPNGPIPYIELSLLTSHLTPPLLRSTSSNPSASFFLVTHPYGISNPLPLSDTDSLKCALAQLDNSLQSIYFNSISPLVYQPSPQIIPSTPSPSYLSPVLPPDHPFPHRYGLLLVHNLLPMSLSQFSEPPDPKQLDRKLLDP